MSKLWKNNRQNHKVLKTNDKPKHGMYSVIEDCHGGYESIAENVIKEQYTECDENHYKKHRIVKDYYGR